MKRSKAGFILPFLMLAACTVGPTYKAPDIGLPATFSASDAASGDMSQWWKAFKDPELDDLIDRAQSGNLDVQQAVARIAQARAQEQATRADGGPSLSVSAQESESKLSKNSLPSALANLGGGGGGGGGGAGIGLAGEHFKTYQTGFDASWEIDLFGGQRRANEAAAARTDAALWSQRDAAVILCAEVAKNYQQYRTLQRRIKITDETLAASREQLDVVKVRAINGLVTTLDERRQQADIGQIAAEREDLIAQADTRVHALGTLLGLPPTALEVELSKPSVHAAKYINVPLGLPSELLQRRPDIRAAERKLAASSADIGVATADLYPKFSLTGALQLASRSLSTLVESDSISANGAGNISLPLLGRDASHANVRLREAQNQEALLAYQASVLTALKDVEDALTRLGADRRRIDRLRTTERAAKDAADTTGVRYRHGLIGYIEVLDSNRTHLTAREALAGAEGDAAQDLIAFYKALGGGWGETNADKGVARGKGK
ncbi:MAG: efflux transporter outer membrane subunit [Micavibrio sp.]|nr:efflux transporter outer membrane subunit [Micavibrio sp.]